jgi:mRNA interferase YafQ
MYKIEYTNRFQKDVRRCQKRGLEIGLLQKAVKLLEQTGTLPVEYRPHKLKGNRKNQWECHIEPDWLMTWEQDDTKLTLLFIQTGTHSDLFG